MTIIGPLGAASARETDSLLDRVSDYMTWFPNTFTSRYVALERFRVDADAQTRYSVLHAPAQVEMWAWVSEGLTREAQTELDSR